MQTKNKKNKKNKKKTLYFPNFKTDIRSDEEISYAMGSSDIEEVRRKHAEACVRMDTIRKEKYEKALKEKDFDTILSMLKNRSIIDILKIAFNKKSIV